MTKVIVVPHDPQKLLSLAIYPGHTRRWRNKVRAWNMMVLSRMGGQKHETKNH
jgi:hypothetical protein